MNIKWTDKITKELWRITHQKSIENQIKRRKWNWIGHTLCKEIGAIEKTALDWNPQEYRRRGRLKRTWRRTIEDEIRSTRSWNEVKGIAGDRSAWKLFMDALCSTRSERTSLMMMMMMFKDEIYCNNACAAEDCVCVWGGEHIQDALSPISPAEF